MQLFLGFVLAILTSIVCALPFGLVNLSVMDQSYKRGYREAMHLSFGAALVEVIYGLIALVAGTAIGLILEQQKWAYYLFLSVPALVGIYFLLKKPTVKTREEEQNGGFLKGVLLNLLSLQVFLFWLLAIAYLDAWLNFSLSPLFLLVFTIGIFLGKTGVLWIYARLSSIILGKLKFVAARIDKFIGIVLLASSLLQIVKK